ncbi:MAG: hypothetical protein LBM77_11000 [Spirochaetaceae bacterium]|jgi:hypothetical protein|nr:hypothetical protein [Spirochaetaceae bacterium]
MKNNKFLFTGMLALGLAFTLVLTGCPKDPPAGPPQTAEHYFYDTDETVDGTTFNNYMGAPLAAWFANVDTNWGNGKSGIESADYEAHQKILNTIFEHLVDEGYTASSVTTATADFSWASVGKGIIYLGKVEEGQEYKLQYTKEVGTDPAQTSVHSVTFTK